MTHIAETDKIIGGGYMISEDVLLIDPILKDTPILYNQVLVHEFKHKEYGLNLIKHLLLDFNDRKLCLTDDWFLYMSKKQHSINKSLHDELTIIIVCLYSIFHLFIDVYFLPIYIYKRRSWRRKHESHTRAG